MLQDGLDSRGAWVLRFLEQHGGVLSLLGRGAHHPPLVGIGHEGGLTCRARHGVGAEAGEVLARGDRGRPGIPDTVSRVAFEPRLDDHVAVSTGESGSADNVVDGACRYSDAVDRIKRIVWTVQVQ